MAAEPAGLRTREELDEQQLAALLFVQQHSRCALWIDMGLGKTAITLTHISDQIFSYAWNRVLVIGPPLVVQDSWPVERDTWEHTADLTMQELDGTAEQMQAQLRNPVDVDLISIHKLQRLAAAVKRGWVCPWDLVVIDEASMVRNMSSKRWKSAVKLTARQPVDIIELTGTPSPNGLHQVWPQIALLDPEGQRLLPKYKAFLARWFLPVSEYQRKVRPKAHALKTISERCSDIVYTLREEDYLNLPPLFTHRIPIRFPDALMKRYREFERTSVLKLDKEKDAAVRAMSEGALYGKLLQFCAGRIYTDPDEKTFVDIHDLKIERMKEIVEYSDGTPILIARTWQHSRERLRDEFPHICALKTPKDIRAWNAGDIELAEAHPASLGHGTNIQAGGSNLFWYDQTPDLELHMQLRKRLHRRGQTASHVNMGFLSVVGTIEDELARELVKKETTQDALREPMRRRLNDVRKELQHGRA